jgi:hypothetical protein
MTRALVERIAAAFAEAAKSDLELEGLILKASLADEKTPLRDACELASLLIEADRA